MENGNEKTYDLTKKVLQFLPDVVGIYLFGSYLTEYETPESDVDIALLFPIASTINSHSKEFRDLLFSLI